MRNIYKLKQVFILIAISISMLFSIVAEAQDNNRDFNSRAYQRAIDNITTLSGGEINANNINAYLNGTLPNGGRSTDDGETIIVSPVIDLVSYDGNEDAEYIVTGTPGLKNITITSISYSPSQPSWITEDSVVIGSGSNDTVLIKININQNNTTEARSVGFIINAQINSVDVNTVAYIIQEGAPEQFIVLSPDYQLISFDGENNVGFEFILSTVVNQNDIIISWPNGDPDWIDQGVVTMNTDGKSGTIILNVDLNPDPSIRTDSMKVSAAINGVNVADSVAIIQEGAPEQFIVLSPDYQVVSFIGEDNLQFEFLLSDVVNQNDIIISWPNGDPDWIDQGVVTLNTDGKSGTIILNVDLNPDPSIRTDSMKISAAINGVNVADSVAIIQEGAPEQYIIVTPDYQLISFDGENNVGFEFLLSNVVNQNDIIISWPSGDPDWIDQGVVTMNTDGKSGTIILNVDLNPNPSIRIDSMKVSAVVNGVNVADSVAIIQEPDADKYIFITPDFQSVSFETDTSEKFDIYSRLDNDWKVFISVEDTNWISVHENVQTADENYVTFIAQRNTGNNFRQTIIKIEEIGNPDIYDTLMILQTAAPYPQLLTAPREQFVGHMGNDAVEFKVTAVNTDGNWLVDENATQSWVNNFSYNYNDSTFSFNVDRNTTLHTRTDSIIIYANYTPTNSMLYDTVAVHQYSGLDSYLLAEPREQAVLYTDTTIQFKITAVNIDSVWLVDAASMEDWITYDTSYVDSLLYFNINHNYSDSTRRDSIRIYAYYGDTLVEDTVAVYQYAGPRPYLLAAPREQTVSHEGNDGVTFDITVVNIPPDGWEVDTNRKQSWIEVVDQGNNHLILDIEKNDSLETRIDTIWYWLKTDHTVYDSVFIYQYSALDTFLIAAPREQQVFYIGDTIDFEITAVNLPGGWEIDAETVEEQWITANKIGNILQLEVSKNDSLETRIDTIRIFATGYPGVEDSVVIYQYSRPDPFLIAEPREHRVSHLGDSTLTFEITVVNVPGGWFMPDSTRQDEWIKSVIIEGGDSLVLKVLENKTLKTRIDTLWYFANEDHSVYDSIFVYQYSALDTFLLAAPREQTALYSGDSLVFDITTANAPGGWEIIGDTTSWIINRTNINDQDSLLSLTITENPFFETRQATVYYQAIDYPNVFDSVTVYQYAQPTPYLLAHPRERKASHMGDTLDYIVLPVNLGDSGWTADTTTFKEWVTFDEEASNDTLLVLNIEANESLVTRMDTVTIYAIDPAGDEDVTDEVIIYQYSGLDKYLLAEPREWEVPAEGENDIIFTITPVNLGEAGWQILDESVAEWVTAEISGDTLLLDVSRNLSIETRSNTITIYSPVYEGVKDSVTVYQFAGGSNFILAHPRERKISHLGEQDVEFQVTSVNNENWTFDPLTINDWMIDSPQKDDNTFRFNVVRNDSLTTLINKIILHATDSLEIKDTVVVYQYSSLDAYILASPREHFVSIYRDTAVFDILAVNLDTDWDVDANSVEDWIGDYWKDPSGTRLFVDVETNESVLDRKDYIRITGQYNNSTIVDSILVIQEAPSLIFNPYALDMIPALKEGTADTILPVYTFSNFAEYVVFKQDPTEDWYSISSKYNTPAADTISLNYNDTIFIKVDLNPSSFSHRQAFLRFRSPDLRIDKSYYIHQNEAGRVEYNLSGTISLEGNPDSTLPGIKVIVGEEDTITDILGIYSMSVLKGWRGSVTPVVDKYFFYPESVPIDRPVDGHKTVNFEAYEIKPQLAFTLDSTSICIGETLKSNEINRYPNALITGTYQLDIKYKWSSIPNDTALARQDTLLNPEFKPIVNTIYQLIITNQGLNDTARFKLIVRPRPQVTEFYGLTPDTVCRNQAGAIYLADIDSASAEHFHWRLHDGGGTFDTLSNSNIAIVNWGNEPGSYGLTLKSHNEHGCSATDSVVRVITVSDQEAPPQTTVQWKNPDNMLYCTDPLVDHCIWGWFEMDGTNLIEEPYIIPDKNDWYVRLPDNHEFNPLKNHYFVITFYDSLSCGSLTFYNPPLDVPEHNDGKISVFPNPTNGLINIRFNNLSESQSGTLQLYNIAGQIIYQEDLNLVRNNSIVTVRDVSYPDAGIYILRIRTEDYFFNTKIVVR